jgi:hypothetical protein
MTEFTRLTARHTPDWSSARSINVEREMRAAFATNMQVAMDIPARPDNQPLAPTLSPEGIALVAYNQGPEIPVSEPRRPMKHGKNLIKSRTMQGAVASEAAGSALVVDSSTELAGAAQQAEASISAGTVFSLVIGLIIMFGAGFAIYARWDDAGRPLPGFIERRLKKKEPE